MLGEDSRTPDQVHEEEKGIFFFMGIFFGLPMAATLFVTIACLILKYFWGVPYTGGVGNNWSDPRPRGPLCSHQDVDYASLWVHQAFFGIGVPLLVLGVVAGYLIGRYVRSNG